MRRTSSRPIAAVGGPAGLGLAMLLAVAASYATPLQDDVLLAAAHDGNIALYRTMLHDGARSLAQDPSGNSALVLAISSDRDSMVREVLMHPVDLEARGSLGLTPLGLAVVRGNRYAFERLLQRGVDPDGADAYGVTPLASAARLGRSEMAQRLLERGADPDRADRDGVGPLHIAAERGDLELARALLARRANGNALDREHRSPFFVALLGGHPETAALLLSDPHCNVRQLSQGYDARHWAEVFDRPELVQAIDRRASR